MRRLTAALVLGAVLCGCDAASSSPAPGASAGPTAGGSDSLTGSLLQFRRDSEARQVQVRLTADRAGVVVEDVSVDVDGFRPSPTWHGPTALPEGRALDLPVTLTAADCTAAPTRVTARVTVRGRPDPLAVPLHDGGLLSRLHDDECAAEALLDHVRIEVVRLEEIRVQDAAALRATVRFTRRSGGDAVRIDGVTGNTVYGITPAGDLPTLGASGSVDLLLDLVPARCDAHALGESYRTSLIDLRVAVGQEAPRPFVFAPADSVRRQIEHFAVVTCRARGGG